MNTAFIQDYADVEVTARQRAAIAGYARNRGIEIDAWVNASDFSIDSLRAGDELLVEKTFRLAKDVRSIAALLEALLSKGVVICSCEDGLRFGGEEESSAQMAYLFGMVAKIAEELRSQLTGRETEIARLLADGCSRNKIARHLHVHPATVKSFIQKSPELKVYADA